MNSVKGKSEWNNILDEEFTGFNDIYFRYEYFELYKKHYNIEPEGLFWENSDVKIFWTHLIRDISTIEQFKKMNYYDLTTPYGYGGPLVVTKTQNKERLNNSLKDFFEQYKKHALQSGYVCEFVRFHPIFENWKFCEKFLPIDYLNDVVVVDLTEDLENIWKTFRKGHKYNIKKTMRESCTVEIIEDPGENDIDTFSKLYYEAMDKNEAEKKYYFSREFLYDHFNLLNSILVEATYKNHIIGASIFIFGNQIMHYHLSGSTGTLKGVYPSELILWEAIKWAKINKFKLFHLGGGRGKNDSLFNFKQGFSKITYRFYTGKNTFDRKVYNKLLAASGISMKKNGYFPAYRKGIDESIT